MTRRLLVAGAIAALAAGPALAQPTGAGNPSTTILCLDVSGQSLPAVCHVPASRLDKSEYFCRCPRGFPTIVPICPTGVEPPAESAALERARRAAMRGGTLVGATFEGKPMCAAPRHSGPNG